MSDSHKCVEYLTKLRRNVIKLEKSENDKSKTTFFWR